MDSVEFSLPDCLAFLASTLVPDEAASVAACELRLTGAVPGLPVGRNAREKKARSLAGDAACSSIGDCVCTASDAPSARFEVATLRPDLTAPACGAGFACGRTSLGDSSSPHSCALCNAASARSTVCTSCRYATAIRIQQAGESLAAARLFLRGLTGGRRERRCAGIGCDLWGLNHHCALFKMASTSARARLAASSRLLTGKARFPFAGRRVALRSS